MTEVTGSSSHRILIVGGGVAGLSAAVRLAQAGLPVTLFEASTLGHAASTRNQGWLHSGALYAQADRELAASCYQSIQQTMQFCPDCLEPNSESMAYLFADSGTNIPAWLSAWESAGIPFQELSIEDIQQEFPQLNTSLLRAGYRLPDRVIRPDVLLNRLAATAEHLGVEIRTETPITGFLRDNGCVTGVTAGSGEEISGSAVILACGATGASMWSQIHETHAGEQSEYTRVALKSHLISICPELSRLPFCLADRGGFNHLPHTGCSVVGNNHWKTISDPNETDVDESEIEATLETLQEFVPEFDRAQAEIKSWSGVSIQAMHVEQIEPGEAPLPTVIDHSTESPCVENLFSIFPGRATLWPQLAEQTRQAVLEKLEHTDLTTATPPWEILG